MKLVLKLCLFLCVAFAAGQVVAKPPRLVVVISVDQYCQEYFERFHDTLRANEGFYALMLQRGAIYNNAHHAHAFTITAPGHAVQLTGAYPQQHGIIGNEWYDRATKKQMYCVTDKTCTTIGVAEGDGPCSPRNLQATTVGDMLKLSTNKKGKVIGVSLKDRAAILMTGQLADAAYWFEEKEGNWATSSYYRNDLPGYIRQINEGRFADRYAEAEWKLLHSEGQYHPEVPDDYAAENPPKGLGRAFPHKLPPAGKALYEQLRVTPFGNEMTLAVAKDVLVHEQLGQDDIPDMLCINFSSNDYVGHAFGPHSLEVEDITYRTDRILREFVDFVEANVESCVFALTADHGVCPLPELLKEKGITRAGRDPLGGQSKVQAQLEPLLRSRLKLGEVEGKLVERVESNQLYLAKDHPALAGENFALAQEICYEWLVAQPAIHTAVTRDNLLLGRGGGAFNAAFVKTFHPERSGDLLWAYEPYYLCGGSGTTHGSPWRYDTHVPLMLYGPGIQQGLTLRRVSPAALAPTMAHVLSVDAPPLCVEEPLFEALQLSKPTP